MSPSLHYVHRVTHDVLIRMGRQRFLYSTWAVGGNSKTTSQKKSTNQAPRHDGPLCSLFTCKLSWPLFWEYMKSKWNYEGCCKLELWKSLPDVWLMDSDGVALHHERGEHIRWWRWELPGPSGRVVGSGRFSGESAEPSEQAPKIFKTEMRDAPKKRT